MPAFNYSALFLGLLSLFGTITMIVIAYSAYKQQHWGLMIFSICCCVLVLFIGFGTIYENTVVDITCAQCGHNYRSEDYDHCPICGTPTDEDLFRCEFCDKVYPEDSFYCPYCGMSKMRIDKEEPHA